MRFLHLLLILIIGYVSAGQNDRYLVSPNPEKCKTRTKEFQYDGRNYFYSGHDKELKDQKTDWLDSRNTCRERCMETVSFETQAEFDFVKKFIEEKNIKFIWTSGRLCDFAGCEGRWDLLPKIVKGWLWSANQKQLDDTNKIPNGWDYTPWSRNGTLKRKQPDNAEFFINQATESCLGVLNNQYNDSVTWHDIACYHRTGFICEDSLELLSEAQEIKSQSENREEIVEIAPQKIITEPKPTTTSAPRSSRVTTSAAKITTERRTSPVPTTVKSTTEKKIPIISQTTANEEKTTETPTNIIETSKGPKFGGRRTRTRTTPSSTTTLEETTSQSTTTTKEAKIVEDIVQKPRKLILDTEEQILNKVQEELPVIVAKLHDQPEIIVKVEDEPVIIVKIEEEIKLTEAPIIEELTTVEAITTEEPKVSTKKTFIKRKKIFGKLKPRPVAVTEEPDSFSPVPEQLSPVSEVKKNFRKIKPRPTTTSTEQPDVIVSTTEQLTSASIARKSFRKLVTRSTTSVPETIRTSESLEDSSRPKKIFGKLKFRTTTTKDVESTSTTVEPESISTSIEPEEITKTEQLAQEISEISTESSLSKSSDDLVELQKIDEPILTTTEEPEPEERRAIPIKRKQVKLYRKGRRNVLRQ
ncbi:hypothetical protein ACKWTF_004816 [Chironomus riparius]